MKSFLTNVGSMGGVVVGLLAAALAGCGDSPTTAAKRPQQQQQAQITQREMNIDQCAANAVFDITSAEAIDFVAIDRSDLASINMTVSTVDEEGRESLVDERVTEADSTFQEMLNTATNNINAEQLSSIIARESSNHDAVSTSVETVTSDSSSTSQNASDSSSKNMSDQHMDSQRRSSEEIVTSDTAAQRAAKAVDSAASADLAEARQNGVASNTRRSSDDLLSTDEASESASSNVSRVANSLVQNEFSDLSSLVTANQSASNAARSNNSSAKTTTSRVADTASKDDFSQQDNSRSETSTAAQDALNRASTSRTRALVMRNLQTLNSRHVVLRVELTADETNEIIRVFTGNEALRSSLHQDFQGTFPGCTFSGAGSAGNIGDGVGGMIVSRVGAPTALVGAGAPRVLGPVIKPR